MTFPSATLSGGNYTSLRGAAWAGASYVSLVPNNVVWKTTLSATATGTTNASVSYGATISGNVADVLIGMRVLIGSVNDIRQATFNGRVRGATPSGGVLQINETSASLTSGMYVWVVDDYPLMDRLSRPVGDPVVQYKDYDLAFQNLLPVVVGIQLGYAGWVNSSGVLRIAFDASSSYAAESGRTISSYQYTFAAGTYAVISGSLATSTVTVDFNPGFQWGQLVVTDSDGRTQTRHFAIWAHNDANPPQLGFQGASITANLNDGWSATVDTYADVSSMLDDTLAIIWTQEYYDGTEGPINTNIDMIGWVRHEDDPARTDPNYALIPSSTFEIAGIGAKLTRIEAQLLALRNAPSPSVWDEINNLTPWRGIAHFLQRHTTLLTLVDLTFDDTTDTFWFPYLSTQGGNALAAVNGIANQINAAMEFAPDGAVRVVRDARFLGSSARSALLTYGNWTSADYNQLTEGYTHEQSLGKVDADGAFFQTSTGAFPAFRSRAPGLAQDIGPDTVSLSNQILAAGTNAATAQSELNQRAGDQYEIASTPSYHLAVTHPDSYHFLIPSLAIWYTWTLTGGTDNIRGISYDTTTRWLLLDISIAINNDDGTRNVQVNYIKETPIGSPGTTIQIPADGTIDASLPLIPPLDPFPAFPDFPEYWLGDSPTPDQILPFTTPGTTPGVVAPLNGNTVLIYTDTQVWITTQFIAAAAPNWIEITPTTLSTYQIKQVIFDPFSTTAGVYLVASDGSNSAVWYTANALNSPPTWTMGAVLSGVYISIRATSVSGTILIYGSNIASSTTTTTYDFTVSDGGFTDHAVTAGTPGSYSAGVGWVNGDFQSPAANYYRGIYIDKAIAAATVVGVDVTYDLSGLATNQTSSNNCFAILVDGIAQKNITFGAQSNGTNIITSWVGSVPGATTISIFDVSSYYLPSATYAGAVTIKSVSVTTSSAVANDALVARSGDFGASYATPISVGATPGSSGGFDISRVGPTNIAAMDQKTRTATSLGGTYTDTTGGGTTGAEPTLVYIPRYKWGGTNTNANLSAPDFLLGSSALISTEALWKVAGGTPTAITPSVTGTKALPAGPNAAACNYLNGNVLAFVGTISGTAHLFYTSNAGTAWSDRGAMSGALTVRIRAGDRRTIPALFIAGDTILKYSKDGGATLVNRTKPVGGGLLGLEVLG